MSLPLVSIVMPAYNRRVYIDRAIEKIRSQTFPDFELIVVDDGSSDGTADVVARFVSNDRRIHFIRHDRNRGAQAARNTGIRAATGEWVAFQDSDDEWLPESLELRLTVAVKENVNVVHSDCFIAFETSGVRKRFGIKPLSGGIYQELLRAPCPVFPAMLIRRTSLEQVGYLDEAIVSYQEWDTSIRLACENDFGFVHAPTFVYHRHDSESISASSLRSARGYEQIVQKHTYEMKKYLGGSGLAKHRLRTAYYYLRAGAYRPAMNNLLTALKSLL